MTKRYYTYFLRILTTALFFTLLTTGSGHTAQLAIKHLYTVDKYSGNKPFLTPIAVFLDAKRQELYVCDSGAKRLITLSAEGAPLGYFSCRQKGQSSDTEPAAVAVSDDRTVFVSDASVGKIYEYDFRGEPLGSISMPGVKLDKLPGKMAIDAAGNIYVAVRNAAKIVVLSPAGKVKTEITDPSAKSNQTYCDIAVDSDGNVYALSPSSAAVHVFDKQGKHIREFGEHGPSKGEFSRPSGIDIDSQGRLWIADMVSQTIKAFKTDGTFLKSFDAADAEGFFFPADLCIDKLKNRLYVVEKNGQRLQAFSIVER